MLSDALVCNLGQRSTVLLKSQFSSSTDADKYVSQSSYNYPIYHFHVITGRKMGQDVSNLLLVAPTIP